jgi:hypothetical protein
MKKFKEILTEGEFKDTNMKFISAQKKYQKALDDLTWELVSGFGGVKKDVPGVKKSVQKAIEKMVAKDFS